MSVGQLSTLNHEGDARLMWDSQAPAEVAAAQQLFDSLIAKGYFAYSVTGPEGAKGEQIREFDAAAEKIIMVPSLQGG